MSSKNILRLLNAAIADGGELDLEFGDNNLLTFGTGTDAAGDATIGWDGTQLNLLPIVDDSIFKIGNGTLSFDVWMYGSAAANYVSWDASANDLKFEDSVSIMFGTGAGAGPGTAGDVEARWDGTDFDILPAVDDSIMKIGNGTLSFDVWLFGSSANSYISWDASTSLLKLEDSVGLYFGTGVGAGPGNNGDVRLRWNATIFELFAVVDDSIFKIGDGTTNLDVWMYGNTVTSYMEWDASASQLGLFGPARPRGFNSISPRYELKWVAGARGKPGLNADILSATEATREIADPDFELLGLNAVSSTSAIAVEGGVTLTTTTGSADQVIIVPHVDASQTAWSTVTWGTDQQTEWECFIRTPATITNMTVWAGLKLTNTSVTATDDDQAFFRFQPSVNSGKWQAIYSIADSDTAGDSGVTVDASTNYHLKITIDSARIARFYIDGVLVATSTALTTAIDLIPYIGVQTDTTAARSLTAYGQSISRVPA